ncbi:unnamed protein product [Agarophyton chilense]|eukprot:gb/GEZJ01001704.1/.p1 GENE.gb/GEZJ01001704.1/~~gb/GEZJ01001704.1/.p1  ORF type:complete len:448 (-),score=96.08 gb/GEZJ01001704.1/:929-2272(-)
MAFAGVPLVPFRADSSLFTPRLISFRPRVTDYPCSRIMPRAQLVGMPEGFGQKNVDSNDLETLLAEMRYSDPSRLPAIVQNNLEQLDEDFYRFLENKINASADLEERDTLRILQSAITEVMKELLDAIPSDEMEAAMNGSANSTIDVSSNEDIAAATYDQLINDIVKARNTDNPYSLKISVEAAYPRIDLRLLERLNERISAKSSDVEALTDMRDLISLIMNERIKAATESVKGVLSVGDPTAMRKEISTLARKGKLDDAFILLLQANLEQAKKANAKQAVDVLSLALNHAQSVKDVQLDPEVRLIRALLRTEDVEVRSKMLMDSFQSQGSVTLIDGSATSGIAVDGKKFVVALRRLIEEFGNVDQSFVLKLSKIGEESEAVARKLYDMEDKDLQDLQEEAFHKRTVSVWDLERYEVEQEIEGRKAAWEGRLGEIPEGFGDDGKMQV